MTSRRALINAHRIIRSAAATRRSSAVPTTASRVYPLFRAGNDLGSRFFCGNTGNPQNFDIDLSNDESRRRLFNRLLYRSKQRGFLELDLVLGNWVEENIGSMDENGVKALIHVLDLENPDLWKWLTDQEQAPEAVRTNPVFSALHDKVMKNLNKHAAPETRAVPGQPWVKGWDDFKKGRDAPIAGNQ
ncbi:PREDICTED: succinate dehydrogenase assembly factor 2, mitochondrial [Tarenaya hassleriana]|uniref:succinate dehydrogenase assembly factor 2, mitochondrial n=1 Tax=Tarenaya hassleriana TaxID=28532 RepID=UPI00053C949B|nr:PREDICTED: succinate dehydrogenase assembly factor 2, mitochondrial [Tarenaya hassleriana]